MCNALNDLLQVGRVEQLRLKRHSKKEFKHPSDPKFGREWSLVCAINQVHVIDSCSNSSVWLLM